MCCCSQINFVDLVVLIGVIVTKQFPYGSTGSVMLGGYDTYSLTSETGGMVELYVFSFTVRPASAPR